MKKDGEKNMNEVKKLSMGETRNAVPGTISTPFTSTRATRVSTFACALL
jgi:hypothetical protein